MKSKESATTVVRQKACMIVTFLIIIFVMHVHMLVEGGECTMAQQLLDPTVRAGYEATVASGRIQDNGWSCGTTPPPGNGESIVFDPITMECINCHDGTIASAIGYRFVKTESGGTTSVVTLQAAHPIGMDYRLYHCTTGFNYGGGLPVEMVFMNGQVGCASCHNLLGTRRLYLAVDMNASGLCFACHTK